MNTLKNEPKKKVDPLEEVINLMLKSQAKTCVRAKIILEQREAEDTKK